MICRSLLIGLVIAAWTSLAANTNRVKLAVVESTAPAKILDAHPLQEENKLPCILLKEIQALVSANKLPSLVISKVEALVSANKLSVSVLNEIVELVSADKLSPTVFDTVVALLSADKLTEQQMVDIALLVEANKLDMTILKRFVALVKEEKRSRFDLLSPGTFSTLWILKMKGKAEELKGNNTDALWKKYWDIFMQMED